jgi:hypothetical protein
MELKFRRKLRKNSLGYFYISLPKPVGDSIGKNILVKVLEDHIELWPEVVARR